MTRTLVAYSTKEGQTAKIAIRLAGYLEALGLDVIVRDLETDPIVDQDLQSVVAFVLGASIHMGRYPPSLTRFAEQHLTQLEQMPSFFFSVCLSAASKRDEDRIQAKGYVQHFQEAVGWKPNETAVFAGRLAFTKYGWFKRRLVQAIARKMEAPTDMSRDHEFTNWRDVEAFAAMVAHHASNPRRAA